METAAGTELMGAAGDLERARERMTAAYDAFVLRKLEFETARDRLLKAAAGMQAPSPDAPKKSGRATGSASRRRDGKQRIVAFIALHPGTTLADIHRETGISETYLRNNLLPTIAREGLANNHLGSWTVADRAYGEEAHGNA